MSLDDAINAARRQAADRAADARRADERQQREQAQAHALALEAVARLQSLGTEMFVRVEPVQQPEQPGECYVGQDGTRYRTVAQQRCWMLIDMAGIYGDEGPWLPSPVLLLEDGTIGRFWPVPAIPSRRQGEYVATRDLEAVEKHLIPWDHESYLDGLKRRLAEAIVRYQNAAE